MTETDTPPARLAAPPRPPDQERTLIVVDDDHDEAQRLALQLSYFGYRVHVGHAAADLADMVGRVRPDALILDLMFPEGEGAGPAAAALLRGVAAPPPTVFLSTRTDLTARLHGVRAGGSAYFPKPVDINELVSTLDRLTGVTQPIPSRVLLVDDSALSARVHAAILRSAGMEVATVTEPQELLYALAEHAPDLVLMDIYMPGCNGLELAAVIRQQAAYHSMPIVFLSGERDRERQLAALGQGGDDFLTKPVKPAHLIAAVASRLERARTIRGQMNRDSLTGLLTHAALKEALAREIARGRRYGSAVSVAMLDVDHFKRVNDTHGHAAGDRVLTSLARLLRQQLRGSDVVGRLGGEEFVVVLPETGVATAFAVVDRIRAQFADVQHTGATQTPFAVTFSTGIAAVEPYESPEHVLAVADAALYGAKQRGRNCVVLADAPQPPRARRRARRNRP